MARHSVTTDMPALFLAVAQATNSATVFALSLDFLAFTLLRFFYWVA